LQGVHRLPDGSRLPDWLGIGAPKTATTFISACLREHPEVFVPSVKEPHFFNYGIKDGMSLDDYAHYFREAEPGQTAGEFSASYFEDPIVTQRVKETLPHARLIASVRNPIDLLYSYYWQGRRQNFWQIERTEWNLPFETAIERYEQPLFAPALLGSALERWLAAFPRERMHVVVQSDVKEDAALEVRRVYEFLGVDSTFIPSALSATTQRSVHGGVSPRGGAVSWLYSTLYRGAIIGAVRPMRRFLGERQTKTLLTNLRIRDFTRKVFFRKGYEQMKPETRAMLAERFRPEVEKLEAILGRSFESWKRAD
jgi:hypothetical protein